MNATALRNQPSQRLTVLVGILFIYLVSPAFTSAHVEGFSAQIQSLALALAGGWVDRHDLDLPLVSQFILTSRPGVIAILGTLDVLAGGSSDASFRLLTALSLFALLAASCVFARRWGGVRYPTSLLALLVVPGGLTLGFYFNDNVVAAAFAASAMAAVGPPSRVPTFVAAGVCMAMAVLCRIDSMLAVPMIALMAAAQGSSFRRLILAALAFALGFVPVLVVAALMLRFTIFDSLALAQLFQVPGGHFRGLLRGLYFFGLISPPLLALGASWELQTLAGWRTLRGQPERLWRFVLLILYPALVLAYAAYAASEIRYFFPLLLPVIALHGGKGVELVVATLGRSGLRFAAALAFVILAIILAALPSMLVNVRDGPASLTGELWSPSLWRGWQGLQERSLARVDAIARDAERRQRTVVVSSSWNDEFYLRLRLMEAGFRNVETPAAFAGCQGFATYRRGGSTVLHVRLWPEYWRSPFAQAEHAALFLTTAYECPAVRASPNNWLTTFGIVSVPLIEVQGFPALRFAEPADVQVSTNPLDAAMRRHLPGPLKSPPDMPLLLARRMSAAELAHLASQSQAVLPGPKPLSEVDRARLVRKASEPYRAVPLMH